VVNHLSQIQADVLISVLKLRDDRSFVRQCLVGIYGSKRLALVNEYLDQWKQGSEAENIAHKKENAGRFRSNTWLRTRGEK